MGIVCKCVLSSVTGNSTSSNLSAAKLEGLLTCVHVCFVSVADDRVLVGVSVSLKPATPFAGGVGAEWGGLGCQLANHQIQVCASSSLPDGHWCCAKLPCISGQQMNYQLYIVYSHGGSEFSVRNIRCDCA